jgi:hypothetical protein
MKKPKKLGHTLFIVLIIILVFFAGYYIANLNNNSIKLQEEWSKHLDNGDFYIGNGKWIPNFTNVQIIDPSIRLMDWEEKHCDCVCK